MKSSITSNRDNRPSHLVLGTSRLLADIFISSAALALTVLIAVYQAQRHFSVSQALEPFLDPENWWLYATPVAFPLAFGIFGLYGPSKPEQARKKLVMSSVVSVITAIAIIGAAYSFEVPKYIQYALVGFCTSAAVGMIAARLLKRIILRQEPNVPSTVGRTVLVVGGAGYIGAVVVRRLLQTGFQVRVLDSLVYGDFALREVLGHKRLEFIQGDCRNIQDVVKAMTGVGSVIHLAAIVGDPACDQDHKTAFETNYAATRMMIEVAKGERVERYIFASSCSVYGASDQIMYEHSAPRPISLYAETKVDSEKALLAATSENFHPTVLRFSTIFGLAPRPRFDLVVNLLAARAIQEKMVTVFNGEQWRPFLHVSDAAESILKALQAPTEIVSGEIFNVGDDRMNYCLSNIAEMIQTVFPGTRVEHVENADRRSYRVSFDKVRNSLGFRCTRTIQDGLEEVRDAFATKRISDYRDPYYSNVQFLKKHGSPVHRDSNDAQVMAAFAGR